MFATHTFGLLADFRHVMIEKARGMLESTDLPILDKSCAEL